jgi:hypothetical protein
MPVEFLYTPAHPDNPFEIAKQRLMAHIARLPVPVIDVTPAPEQLHDVADHVRAVAQAADEWLLLVGLEVKSNALSRVDLSQFQEQFESAVDGLSIFEIEKAAEIIRDDYEGAA